jgi:hypothetical protein
LPLRALWHPFLMALWGQQELRFGDGELARRFREDSKLDRIVKAVIDKIPVDHQLALWGK